MRKFIRNGRAGALLAICIAYTLAIEAVMASVGLGMSAVAAPDQTGFVICSFAAGPAAHAPARSGEPQNQTPQPQCPFCFVAGQSAGQLATAGDPPEFLAYAASRVIGTLSDHCGDNIVLPQSRRTAGSPRAPPAFSV